MAKFEACFESFAKDFKSFSDEEKNLAIEKILLLCEPQQLHILSDQLPNLVKRDFIRFLPIELVFHVIKYLDYKTLGRCCKVSKSWNSILSNYPDIWESWCASVGVLNSQKLTTSDVNWKLQLQEGLGRLQRLGTHFFPKRNLVRHTDSVRALCYNDGFLATGNSRDGDFPPCMVEGERGWAASPFLMGEVLHMLQFVGHNSHYYIPECKL